MHFFSSINKVYLKKSLVYSLIRLALKAYSDIEILEGLKRRENPVVTHIHRVYMPMVMLLAFRSGGTKEDAEDLFNQMIEVLINKLDKEEIILRCKLRTYIYSICGNLLKMEIRNKASSLKYRSQLAVCENDNDFTENHDRDIYERIFLESLSKIDSEKQILLKLSWRKMPLSEIATKLGYTYSNLRKKNCVAKAEFISKIKEHPDFRKIEFSNLLIEKKILL
jgi:RNA polymerase sigma factor (sigma-70 family)